MNVKENVSGYKRRHFLLRAKRTGAAALLFNVNAIGPNAGYIDHIPAQFNPHAIIDRYAEFCLIELTDVKH